MMRTCPCPGQLTGMQVGCMHGSHLLAATAAANVLKVGPALPDGVPAASTAAGATTSQRPLSVASRLKRRHVRAALATVGKGSRKSSTYGAHGAGLHEVLAALRSRGGPCIPCTCVCQFLCLHLAMHECVQCIGRTSVAYAARPLPPLRPYLHQEGVVQVTQCRLQDIITTSEFLYVAGSRSQAWPACVPAILLTAGRFMPYWLLRFANSVCVLWKGTLGLPTVKG